MSEIPGLSCICGGPSTLEHMLDCARAREMQDQFVNYEPETGNS